MKRIYIILFTLLIYSTSIYPQWTNQNPVPNGNHLLATFFIDDNTGWVVGSEGFVKKTTNAGLDWVQQNSGTTFILKSIQFVNLNTGWICGEEGLIIKTTDGGHSWFEQMSGTAELLTDLQFLDLNIGYVVGYNETILKTTDGGTNWVTQQAGSAYDLFSVDLVNALLGYAVGGRDSTKFLKTTDGGLNWVCSTLIINNTPKLNCVEFINPNVGWVGYGSDKYSASLEKTTDGGETWFSSAFSPSSQKDIVLHIQEDIPIDTQVGIRSIYFKDSNNGYAVGGTLDGWNRCIYSTTDAGTTWQPKYLSSEQTGLLSVFVNSNGKGWAVGYYGVIYLTEDNGSTWYQILSGTQSSWTGDWISSIYMVNDSVGWAAGFRKGYQDYMIILKTTNGGRIWKTNFQYAWAYSKTETNIFFINENIGWISFYDNASYKTIDGGDSWYADGGIGENEKYFINQDTGWAAHSILGIKKTTNGGANWLQKSSVSSRSIFFSDINNGWAVGEEGSILKSTDSGETWNTKTSGSSSNLNSVRFHDNNIGLCVGNTGTILSSTNGGENWISQIVCITASLNSVVFTNQTTAWIVGSEGTILYTTDLGNSWIPYTGITEVNLASIFFTDENNGWVCGDNDIFKYQDDVVPVELLSFTANLTNKKILLAWQTATEVNNLGFEVERRSDDEIWNNLGFVEGHGNSTLPNSYSFTDNNPIGESTFHYRLKQIDLDGKYEYSDEIEVEIIPNEYVLYQNYPNPFNPTTKISYQISNESKVIITIYDILGKEVATLVNESKKPGRYEVELNANNLASGTYICTLVAGDFVESKKMVLLR